MSILIIGSEGSQGKRYQAILNYLKTPFFCVDKKLKNVPPFIVKEQVTGIIIATPTDTHVDIIREYLLYQKPILCEKPVTKNIGELRSLIPELRESDFAMVSQYRQLLTDWACEEDGESYYDYFKHGNDGLVWDCLQIIGLANGEVTIEEASPTWQCKINGETLRIQSMDWAYVDEIKDWLTKEPRLSLSQILEFHEKTAAFERSHL